MRKYLPQICMGLLCLVLGFVLTATIKSIYAHQQAGDLSSMTEQQLQESLIKQQEENQILRDQNDQLAVDLDSYQRQIAQSSDAGQAMLDQLERLEILAGTSELTGPGIRVTLRDSRQAAEPGVNENFYVIHDEDLLRVINELKSAGAEAISINGERLVSTSEIRCVGSTVIINDNQYAAPFEITAIGDAQTLEGALRMSHGVVDILTSWGIEVTIQKEESVTVPAYGGTQQFTYAKPVEADTEEE